MTNVEHRSVWNWFTRDFLGIVREMRLSYLPPLMVYLAAGVSGFTGIIEGFFVKDQLGLSAAFLAGLGFWAGLPWALKMPFGHLVDLYWHRKALFVYLGAILMAGSLMIMVGLTGHKDFMASIMALDVWYIIATLISPVGYVLQDVVADAMTVEAVQPYDEEGRPIPEKELQRMHITMQTLGRIAIIGGSAIVAGVGGWLATIMSYYAMYQLSLIIPVISVLGAVIGAWNVRKLRIHYRRSGRSEEEICDLLRSEECAQKPDWYILGGGVVFVAVSLFIGLSRFGAKKEIIFLASLAIVIYLMRQLLKDLDPLKRRDIIGIAIIIFVFRAMPGLGAGSMWWQIDALKFDEAFFHYFGNGLINPISGLSIFLGKFPWPRDETFHL